MLRCRVRKVRWPFQKLPAQIDTAADMTVLPASLGHQLRLVQLDAIPVVASGGIRRTFPTFLVRLTLCGQGPGAMEILSSAEEPHVLLGRDLVNRYRLVLDGPRGVLEID